MNALERLARRKRTLLRVLLGAFGAYLALTVYLALEGELSRPKAWGDAVMLSLTASMVILFIAILVIRRRERQYRENDKTGG